jgi:Flp pilus assembly protein TadB
MQQDNRYIKDTLAKIISRQVQEDLQKGIGRNYWCDTSRLASKKEVVYAFALIAAVIFAWIIGALYSKIIMGIIFGIILMVLIYQYVLISKRGKN